MSNKSAYLRLSKAGSRILERANTVTRKLKPTNDKVIRRNAPEFLKSGRDQVMEQDRFQSEKQWKYLPGDRVVIVKGKHKGTISVVRNHDSRTNGYTLGENGPTRKVPVPKSLWMKDQVSHVINIPLVLPQDALKLVADIDDEKTGTSKTVAVRDLAFKGSYYDSNYKKMMPYRYVAGEDDLIIPWPKPEHEPDGDLATSPEITREQTYWVDSIVRTPIPNSALPTIRNPHSKYRRRTLKPMDMAKLIAPKMPLTPERKAYLAKEASIKSKAKSKPTLTVDEMEMIGERVRTYLESSKSTPPV
ncbi:hypothetical protein NCAS_0C01140 [Naumovozyma castellii]|uniref:KOW domain-containing protein n=1 Tax=Naumovozyma castellii TaxID=27288 RepID=G0VC95_NAUCA|nr:hypothetical protein NCAS_0C01140 [Naumovozyma castellii CBS 4309]CCC69104.1 hypothetical protein NCAS_0C01140 [Naumovozyma castellii CBS 4309]